MVLKLFPEREDKLDTLKPGKQIVSLKQEFHDCSDHGLPAHRRTDLEDVLPRWCNAYIKRHSGNKNKSVSSSCYYYYH